MNNDPRYIDNEPAMNQTRTHYLTESGGIEPGTVEYVLDLLNRTIDNPNTTVSKSKLKHIAAQLLARNALVERENDVLKDRVAELEALAGTKHLTIDTDKLSLEDIRQIEELMRDGTLATRALGLKAVGQ